MTKPSTSEEHPENIPHNSFINLINKVQLQKWYSVINLVINIEYQVTSKVLIDSRADQNCMREGLIPTKYFEKTSEKNYMVQMDKG